MSMEKPIFEKKNVVVTGGAGFIGSHLCERLLKEAKVICIDDFSHSSIQNIEHLLQYPDFEFIKHDVNQPINLENFDELDKFKVAFQGIQEVYHLACPTTIRNFRDYKTQSLWANSQGMISTLDLAVKYKAKYVFTSSSVVYGAARPEHMIFSEDFLGVVDHLSPRGCYDEGKRFAETCVMTYKQVYGLEVKIARIFSTYGPRMRLRDGRLIPDFILNALAGKDVIVYGDHTTGQTLCYVSDIVDGLVRLMKSGPQIEIVNLGFDQLYIMSEVAQAIISMIGSPSRILYEGSLEDIKQPGVPDLRHAKEQLNWVPLVRLEDGLRKMIDYTVANKELLSLNTL